MIAALYIFFAVLALLALSSRVDRGAKPVYWLFCVFLVFFTAFRDGERVLDYLNYATILDEGGVGIEPGFQLLAWLTREVLGGGIVTLMFFYALLSIPLKFVAIQRYSEFLFLSLLVWIGNLYLVQDFTQVRAAVAASIFLLSLQSLRDREKKYWFYVAAAVLFHYSALLLIPLWWVRGMKINRTVWSAVFAGCFVLGLLHVDLLGIASYIPVANIRSKYEFYRAMQETMDNYQANIFGVSFLSRALLWLVLLWNAQKLAEHSRYAILLLKVMGISLCAFTLFSVNQAFALRLAEFFAIVEILLFPMLLYVVRPPLLGRLALIAYAAVFMYYRIFTTELILPAL